MTFDIFISLLWSYRLIVWMVDCFSWNCSVQSSVFSFIEKLQVYWEVCCLIYNCIMFSLFVPYLKITMIVIIFMLLLNWYSVFQFSLFRIILFFIFVLGYHKISSLLESTQFWYPNSYHKIKRQAVSTKTTIGVYDLFETIKESNSLLQIVCFL